MDFPPLSYVLCPTGGVLHLHETLPPHRVLGHVCWLHRVLLSVYAQEDQQHQGNCHIYYRISRSWCLLQHVERVSNEPFPKRGGRKHHSCGTMYRTVRFSLCFNILCLHGASMMVHIDR
jgi:hypothetical protein